MNSHENIRNTKSIKIDLTTEEGLRRAMQVPPPYSDPKPMAKKKAVKQAAKNR